MSKRCALLLVVSTLLLTGCDTGTGPTGEVRVGIIEWPDTDAAAAPALEIGDTLFAGLRFDITVRTWAPGGSCWEPADDEVTVGQYSVLIVPHDRRRPGPCEDIAVRLSRVIRVTAQTRATDIRVVVSGRRVAEGQNPDSATERVTVEAFRAIP